MLARSSGLLRHGAGCRCEGSGGLVEEGLLGGNAFLESHYAGCQSLAVTNHLMTRATGAVIALCIPCATDLVMLTVLFCIPSFGWRENLKTPFACVYFSAWAAAMVGIPFVWLCHSLPSRRGLLFFFLVVILCNILALILGAGAVASALT